MRPVLFISLLLLSTLLYEAQGRHLRKGGDLPARNHKTNENGSIRRSGEKKIDACKDGQCSSSSSSASAGTMMKRKMPRATKVSHHWLPSIHEDYYGPRRHKARHH
nr:uncharacterized protein LOC109174816 [Ipomoea batatas]